MKQLLLILGTIVLILGTAQAQTAVGYNKWVNDNGDTMRVMGASGIPLTYWTGDEWETIDCNWQETQLDTVWKVNGEYDLFVTASGSVRYQLNDHILDIYQDRLVRFNPIDSSWLTIELSSPDSITIDGDKATLWGVYYGVNMIVQYVNSWYHQRYEFTQAARDSLAKFGGWSGKKIATVSRIDADSLNLDLRDSASAFLICDTGHYIGDYIIGEYECSPVLGLPKEMLYHADSGATGIVVRKYVVKISGTPYLLEMFDAVSASQQPTGTLYHNLTLGTYFTTGGSASDIENYRRAWGTYSPDADGTLDSMKIYIATSNGGSKNMKGAFYHYVAGSDSALVDVTEQVTAAAGLCKMDFVSHSAVTADDTYLAGIWGSSSTGGLEAYYRTGTGFTALSASVTYTGTWPDPYVWSTSAGNEYSCVIYYTEPAEEPGFVDGVIHSPTNQGLMHSPEDVTHVHSP